MNPGPRRMAEANPSFVPYRRPPAGAPDIVMIVLDDVGFGQLGCFGSPLATPSIDRLAAGGLRYNRFHVTSICSSTRAALLTGRNHHAVGVGMTMETPLGFPGYTGRIPPSAALLPRVLRDAGYNTFAVGKWHLTPRGEYSAAGPMSRWPLGQHMGFERFYGFLGAETNQWAPELWRDNTPVEPPRTPVQGYHLTEDLVDQAVVMVQDQRQAAPEKPLFLYFAPGAVHAPHQVPEEWSDAYRGRFDGGWEELRSETFERQLATGVVPAGTRLSDRPPWVAEWARLPQRERRLFARYMEVFAGFLTHTDAQVGRLLDAVVKGDTSRDTIVMLLSDNGASAEGSPTGTLNEAGAWLGGGEDVAEAYERIDDIGGLRGLNHYPWGWAWAGNSPLQLWKRYAWLGGVRTPLIVSWPGRVEEVGTVRAQFVHAIDLAPTLTEVAGIQWPDVVDGVPQQRLDGASIADTFTNPDGAAARDTQYFEMHGSRGIYHRGWKATTDYVSPLFGERRHLTGSTDFDTDRWLLFDLDSDFSEAVDVSASHPARLAEMEELWWREAAANSVLPLFEGPSSLVAMHPAEYPPPTSAEYAPGGSPVYEGALPPLIGGFRIEAELAGAGEGVVCAMGDMHEGLVVYVAGDHSCASVVTGRVTTRLRGPAPRRSVALNFDPGSGLSLEVDGEFAASAAHGAPMLFAAVSTAAGGLLVGRDRGLPIDDGYEPPFPYSGGVRRLVVTSGAPPVGEPGGRAVERAQRYD